MSNISKVYATRSDNGIMVYTIRYKSGRERLEVENLLPKTVKDFINQNTRYSYVFYDGIWDRYFTVYG